MARPLLGFLALALLAIPAHAGDYGEAHDEWTGGLHFYTDAEVIFFERSQNNNADVSLLEPAPGGGVRVVLQTDDVVDDDEELGGRGVLGVRFSETDAVEIVGMGFDHHRSATVRSPGEDLDPVFRDESADGSQFLVNNNVNGDFEAAALHDLEFDSDFYSGELNWRRYHQVPGTGYSFRLLAGIRAARLEEDLTFISWDDNPPVPRTRGGGAVGVYRIQTRNTLAGGHVGVESRVDLFGERVFLDLFASAGGYANQAKVISEFISDQTGRPVRQRRTEWNPAGIFEGSAHLRFRVWGGWRMAFGYRAIYLMGIAVAPDQFTRSAFDSDFFGNSFDDDGHTLFHGPSFQVGYQF